MCKGKTDICESEFYQFSIINNYNVYEFAGLI